MSTAKNLDVEIRITSATGGQKGQKKARLGALDPATLRTVAEVAGFGAEKYDAFNFLKGYDWSLSYDALQRHLMSFWDDEDLDQESGLPHLAHAAWHCLTLLAFQQRMLGTDDRPWTVLHPELLEDEEKPNLNRPFGMSTEAWAQVRERAEEMTPEQTEPKPLTEDLWSERPADVGTERDNLLDRLVDLARRK